MSPRLTRIAYMLSTSWLNTQYLNNNNNNVFISEIQLCLNVCLHDFEETLKYFTATKKRKKESSTTMIIRNNDFEVL